MRFVTLNLAAFGIGFFWHMHGILFSLENSVVDISDGLFNLWVLRRNTEAFSQHDLWQFFHSNVYWPENHHALFFSDILLIPSLVFGAFRKLQFGLLSTYHLTEITLTIVGWIFYSLFFWKIRNFILSQKSTPSWALDALSVYFLYLSFFSISRTYHYIHFQNLSSFFVLLAMYGGWRLLSGKKLGLSLMALAYLLLISSVPYFAILATIFSLIFVSISLINLGVRDFFLRSKWDITLAATIAALSLPIVLGYAHAGQTEEPAFFHSAGISRQDFFALFPMTPLHDFADRYFKIHHGNHEAPAYLGFSLMLLVILFFWGLRSALRLQNSDYSLFGKYRDFARDVLIFIVIGILVFLATLISEHPAHKIILCSILWLAYVRLLVKSAQEIQRNNGDFLVPLVVLLVVTTYAIAFGSSYEDKGSRFDPSIAGFFSLIIPGFHKLRGIGRFVHFAYVFVNVLLLLWIARNWQNLRLLRSRILLIALALLATLQVLETKTGIPLYRVSEPDLQTLPEERLFLQQIHGAAVVWPVPSWEEAVYPMNLVVETPTINIVNGYSGRITKLFDRVLNTSKNTVPHEILYATGIKYLMILKYRLKESNLATTLGAVDSRLWKHIFENHRMTVFEKGAI